MNTAGEEEKHPLPSAEEEGLEETLSRLWALRERGCARWGEAEGALGEALEGLRRAGLVLRQGEDWTFAPEGDARASRVVRRGRLAERLLCDVLRVDPEEAEAEACRMEHTLTPGVSDAICTLLGHPRACPHGAPIPRGGCCERALESAEALLRPLERLRAGERGRVAYLLSPDSPDAQRLLSLGLVPGAELRVEQRWPAFVVRVGEAVVAMESAVARGVFVRPV